MLFVVKRMVRVHLIGQGPREIPLYAQFRPGGWTSNPIAARWFDFAIFAQQVADAINQAHSDLGAGIEPLPLRPFISAERKDA